MATKKWTQEEENFLKENYVNNSKEFILNRLPDRTWKAIRERCVSLGLARNKNLINIDTFNNAKKAIKEKYGVEFSWQAKELSYSHD